MKIKWDFDKWYKFGNRLSEVARFDAMARQATIEITKVLQDMLFQNTPVRTGNLCAGWGGAENYAYTAIKTANGFRVELKNNSCNDKGFRYGYVVNDGGRNENGWFVRGRFFVENSILDTEEKMYPVVYNQLEKWFRRCVNGK